MYCTVAVVVDTVHSSLLQHERTDTFFIVLLQFWLLGQLPSFYGFLAR